MGFGKGCYAIYFPKAAAGYARSFFLRGAVELLRELALLAVALCISAGRSFHSISGRAFWNDKPVAPGLRLGEGPLLLGGSDKAGNGGAVGLFSRFAAAVVVLDGIVVVPSEACASLLTLLSRPSAEVTPLVLICRRTIHALSGRSLK